MYGNIPVAIPHPRCADWNNTKNSQKHCQHLKFVQWKKCVGTYYLHQKKRTDGTEYGDLYFLFRFPLDFHCKRSIEFIEMENGRVRDNFLNKINDPHMNQHCKMHLQSWMYNWYLQIVLDEEQSILYLIQYVSKAGKYSTDMIKILQYLVPLHQEIEKSEV